MRRALVVVCLLLPACSGGPETFFRGLQRGLCKFNRQCTDHEPVALGDCERSYYERVQTPEEFADNCEDYDADVGRDCLRYIRESRRECHDLDARPQACVGICGPGTGIKFFQAGGSEEEAEAAATPWTPALVAE
ncbi:hypothetical protein [Nannocystis sp. SCPEA4]|uniref:hypothetical protein n=1 Tax=Nannocystis sp. SCPEA4 TaxID=2996787 RepID=UPI00226EE1F2|nr:hypothetical protein [Nannocystis sp. SCPEA4]MCY1061691.1 hypothetical protein [Nannocystis sp. SCPEA4]